MKEELDPNNSGKISFAGIISYILKRPKEHSIEDQIMEAFEALQAETGSVCDGEKTYKMSVKEGRKFLMDFGETFTEAEA